MSRPIAKPKAAAAPPKPAAAGASSQTPTYWLAAWLEGHSGLNPKVNEDGSTTYKKSSQAAGIKAACEETGNPLMIVDGQIFCLVCQKSCRDNAKTVLKHVESERHNKLYSAQASLMKNQPKIELNARERQLQKTLLFHYKVAEACLASGVSLRAMEHPLWQQLLGDRLMYREPIRNRRQLSEQVPNLVHNIGNKSILLAGNYPKAIAYDGTTDVAEVFAIMMRIVNEDMDIAEIVLALSFKNGKMTGQQLAAEIERAVKPTALRPTASLPASAPALARDIAPLPLVADVNEGRKLHTIMGGMCDNEQTNVSASEILDTPQVLPRMRHGSCMSHALQNVGVRRKFTEITTGFMSHYQQAIIGSKARELFKATRRIMSNEAHDRYPLRFSQTRWYGQHQQVAELVEWWPAVKKWAASMVASQIGGKTAEALHRLLQDRDTEPAILFELSAHVDIFSTLVRACYLLEGADILAPLVKNELDSIDNAFTVAMAGGHVDTPATRNLLAQGKISAAAAMALSPQLHENLQDVRAYFFSRFRGSADVPGEPKYRGGAAQKKFSSNLLLYYDLDIFNPISLLREKLDQQQSSADKEDNARERLRRILEDDFFRDVLRSKYPGTGVSGPDDARYQQIVDKMMVEREALMAEVESRPLSVGNEEALGMWWRRLLEEKKVPTWCYVMCRVALLFTSSACVERLFSTLNNRLGKLKTRARHEYRLVVASLGAGSRLEFRRPKKWPRPRRYVDPFAPPQAPAAPAAGAGGSSDSDSDSDDDSDSSGDTNGGNGGDNGDAFSITEDVIEGVDGDDEPHQP